MMLGALLHHNNDNRETNVELWYNRKWLVQKE